MPSFNIANVELVWRGITLTGFASGKVDITQLNASSSAVIGIAGECIKVPAHNRCWSIKTTFNPFSLSYPILEQDNLYNTEDTLIVRDLNTGTNDIFTFCTISTVGSKKDGGERTVEWHAVKRNGR